MAAEKKKYSYIKHPFSVNGWYALALSVVALILTMAIVITSIRLVGAVSLFTASLGVTALLMDLMALWFTVLALREKNRNYVIALIGCGIALVVLLIWVFMFL